MRIAIKADEGIGDNLVGKIDEIALARYDFSLDMGIIADVEFGIHLGSGSQGEEPKPAPLKGDVNEDGKVDIADISAIITIMTQNAE